jgi:uncharacterized damage-inducible protein DinB
MIAPIYRGWQLGNERLVARLRDLTPEQLSLPVGSPAWPIWASASHIAGTRVYWLCYVFKEPGAETTPFLGLDLGRVGWEDDLEHPRGAGELVLALESSWKIVEHCLATWTLDSLHEESPRARGDEVQMHTRQSVLLRLITHDAYHCGEISLVLGSHGLGAIDLWSGLARVAR